MIHNYLDFEQSIAELEAKIEALRFASKDSDININEEIKRLKAKSKKLTESIFSSLGPWQVSQLARHAQRPHSLDYIDRIFADYQELHGDRLFGDDAAIVGGLARLDDRPVVVIGHQKGRDTREKVERNFGMPRPEGYRKALRLMNIAERFRLPVVTLIDTPGAELDLDAERRGLGGAIATTISAMARPASALNAMSLSEKHTSTGMSHPFSVLDISAM